jgi:hypothetical protein
MLEEGRRERGDRRGEGCEASGMREREEGIEREGTKGHCKGTLTHFVFSGGLMTLVARQHSPSNEKVVLLSFHPSSFVASGRA